MAPALPRLRTRTTATLALALLLTGCAGTTAGPGGSPTPMTTATASGSPTPEATSSPATPAGPTGTASSSSATRAATASPTPTAEVVVGEAGTENTAVALPDLWEPDLSVRAFEAPTTGLPGLHGVLAAGEDSPLVDEAVEELSGGVTGTGEDGQETSTGGPNALRPHRVLLVCEDPDAGPSSIGYLDPEDLEYVPVAWSEGCGGFSGEIPDAAEGGADTVVTVDVPAWVRYSTAEIRER